ncbi:hypothetical protein lerEdw1_019663 [Lerista edwardsae]|nr:hypothetical protein lerEdw1_019663 [Lerista edwardsae]
MYSTQAPSIFLSRLWSFVVFSGLESGFCTIPRAPRSEKTQESSGLAESALKRSDSLLSFRLDLGPSLMSELLHVISFSGDSSHSSKRGEEEREENNTATSTETFSPLHLKNTWAEDSLPWRSGSPPAACEESQVGSGLWGHSEASWPLGHSGCPNGDSHSMLSSQDGSPSSRGKTPSSPPGATATEGVAPREAPWPGHQKDCHMESREYDRAAQVLARHYGPGGTYRGLSRHQEESRSQASWESPDASTWRLKVGVAQRQEHMARWRQRAEEEEEEVEEEEEEEEEEFSGDGATIVREGNSDSFEYVDDEEEEDEVKV